MLYFEYKSPILFQPIFHITLVEDLGGVGADCRAEQSEKI